MNRLGWLIFDVALVVHRYRRHGAHRPNALRDFSWGAAIRGMGAWRVEATA